VRRRKSLPIRPIFQGQNETEAHLLKNILEAEGIEAEIRSDSPYGTSRLYVREEDYDRAVAIGAGFKTPGPDNPWKWRCDCGEDVEEQFAVCWKCGRERRAD
jgi:hypothetical protein